MARTNNAIFPIINFINETIFENSYKNRRRDDTATRSTAQQSTKTNKQKATTATPRIINMVIGYAKDLSYKF